MGAWYFHNALRELGYKRRAGMRREIQERERLEVGEGGRKEIRGYRKMRSPRRGTRASKRKGRRSR
jgi:hypothetical protein